MFRFFRPKPPPRKESPFQAIITEAEHLLEMEPCPQEQAALLDFFIWYLGQSLASEGVTCYLQSGSSQENLLYDYTYYLPTSLLKQTEQKVWLDAAKVNIYTGLWWDESVVHALSSVRKIGFHADMNYYTGNYFPELRYGVLENGRHHIAAGIYYGCCQVRFRAYSLIPLLDVVQTDGVCFRWVDETGALCLSPPGDYRLTAMYRLLQMKHRLGGDEFTSSPIESA